MRDHILCLDNDEQVRQSLERLMESSYGRYCALTCAHSPQKVRALLASIRSAGDTLSVVVCGAAQAEHAESAVRVSVRLTRLYPQLQSLLLLAPAVVVPTLPPDQSVPALACLDKPVAQDALVQLVRAKLDLVRSRRENGSLREVLRAQRERMEELQRQMEQRIRARTQDLEDDNRRLSQLAVTDGLTGLFNHRYLQEQLVREVQRSLRGKLPLGMLMIDVDHFRLYNNRFGHQTGDEVLRRVARLIGEHRRVSDIVARYGGEEFALLLINADQKVAYRIAEQLRRRVAAEPFPTSRDIPGGHLTISIGVASCPVHGATAEALIAAADQALFHAKREGRNRVCLASLPRAQHEPALTPEAP